MELTELGRYAGRIVQPQNLPQNHLDMLDLARDLVKNKNKEAIEMIYGNIPQTLSELIRTAFIPSEGYVFTVADFSAIEARVISWLAGEQWRLEVFRTHGKIYEASASQMFGVPIDKIKKGNPEYELRQKGKVAELALGYQGGAGALMSMGALDKGLTEEELPEIVQRWRNANKRIVDLWYTVQNCAINCILTGQTQIMQKNICFSCEHNSLVVTLPSRRQLFYVEPKISTEYGKDSLSYMGQNQTTKKWERTPTYGGKMTENIVQAIARDCLAESLLNLTANGFRPLFHIHDEVIAEVLDMGPNSNEIMLQDMIKIMCQTPTWAEGLPLNADGFVNNYYKKE